MDAPPRTHSTIRVLIVEDHPIVAEGLSSLLEDYADLAVVAVAASVAEVGAAIERVSADVALIDFHLPDGTGADAADLIRARHGSTAIVFLSADDSDERLIDAIEAGASSYVLKSARSEEIVRSIRAAAAGQTLIPAGTIARALAVRRESARRRAESEELLASLTSREQEILALMIRGADNMAIAEALHISYATVRTHVRSILRKLDAHSQLDAVAKAAQLGFGVPGQRTDDLQTLREEGPRLLNRRIPTNGGMADREPGGSLLESLALSRSPLTFWHKLLGRLPSSYRQLDAAVDALSERVLDPDATDVPPDVRQLAERVRWAVLTLR